MATKYKVTERAAPVASRQSGGKTYTWYKAKDKRGNTRDFEVMNTERKKKFKIATRNNRSSGSAGG